MINLINGIINYITTLYIYKYIYADEYESDDCSAYSIEWQWKWHIIHAIRSILYRMALFTFSFSIIRFNHSFRIWLLAKTKLHILCVSIISFFIKYFCKNFDVHFFLLHSIIVICRQPPSKPKSSKWSFWIFFSLSCTCSSWYIHDIIFLTNQRKGMFGKAKNARHTHIVSCIKDSFVMSKKSSRWNWIFSSGLGGGMWESKQMSQKQD